jgi:hypothetical protein
MVHMVNGLYVYCAIACFCSVLVFLMKVNNLHLSPFVQDMLDVLLAVLVIGGISVFFYMLKHSA